MEEIKSATKSILFHFFLTLVGLGAWYSSQFFIRPELFEISFLYVLFWAGVYLTILLFVLKNLVKFLDFLVILVISSICWWNDRKIKGKTIEERVKEIDNEFNKEFPVPKS